MKTPLTYFAFFPGSNLYKIGSSVNPERRLRTLRSKYKHHGIHRLVGALESSSLSETDAHAMFAQYRVEGEWYRLTRAAIQKIKGLLPKQWSRRVPRQYGTWMSSADIISMRTLFPASSTSASAQMMVDAMITSFGTPKKRKGGGK